MANLLVVEDDRIQRNNIIKMIEELNLEIDIYEAESQEQALTIAESVNIDFFYIDLELKDSWGIELAKRLREIERYKLSWIIFITSHVKFMLEAFKEIHCYDYIIKPFKKEDIQEVTKLLANNAYKSKEDNLQEKKYVTFNSKGIVVKIYVHEIIFIEVSLRTCTIHTTIGKYEISKISLTKILEIINEENIIQCHRAFGVNVDYIKSLESYTSTSWKILFRKTEEVAFMGFTYKDKLLKMLPKLNQ